MSALEVLLLGITAVTSPLAGPSIHRPDTEPLIDQGRMVTRIDRTGFVVEYATYKPCETKLEVRAGSRFRALVSGANPAYRVVTVGGSGLWHSARVTGLKPGTRYFYRLYDPSATPTATEVRWGADAPWSREYAVSTEAPAGRKTIIHLPVKVLLMPNVVNAASSIQPDGSLAPEPPKTTPEQLTLIENEFKAASRVFWCNSGMRLWVDFQFLVDDRWQRWGPQAAGAAPFFRNLPQCRSYGGKDYKDPGGGTFTVVDTHDLSNIKSGPLRDGFECQVEMAWPRKWDPVARKWVFYVSGGGTLGADELPDGIPARTQFLAGGDTAWLAEHEFHHQLESLGSFCLGNSEDDRIVFDHPSPRHRNRRGDGTYDEQDWTTTGPHGEQWDVMRYWDRQVTDCQWLRLGFGTTETVIDKDGDGFPDADPRLPLDASRMRRYAPESCSYAAACAWDWAMLPLQPSWVKNRSGVEGRIDPLTGLQEWVHVMTSADLKAWHYDGEHPDRRSYWVTMSFTPGCIVPIHKAVDANAGAWERADGLGLTDGYGLIEQPTIQASYRYGYDETGYMGVIVAKGNIGHIDVDLDGEGKGMFTPPGALGFSIVSLKPSAGQAGPTTLPVSVKPTFGGVQGRAPWLTWKAVRKDDGTLIFEFKVPNGGDSPWYWHGAGHQIGVAINAYDTDGRGYSMGEPYQLYYSRMVETRGREPRPPTPAALEAETVTLKPGDKAFTLSPGWSLAEDGAYRHEGDANAIVVGGRKVVDFDLIAEVQGEGEYGIGGYAAQTPRPGADRDYSAIVAGGTAILRINGEADDSERITPAAGFHRLELRRRGGGVWFLVDDQVKGYALDKNPRV
ncbi:MAG TPA: fibronectin type III domain-containing protein, partial [Fimbriimonadaceae bacterium]|nr:fibronectin type III domain-containing protein [Fimbriimonadaceae bacterium]